MILKDSSVPSTAEHSFCYPLQTSHEKYINEMQNKLPMDYDMNGTNYRYSGPPLFIHLIKIFSTLQSNKVSYYIFN